MEPNFLVKELELKNLLQEGLELEVAVIDSMEEAEETLVIEGAEMMTEGVEIEMETGPEGNFYYIICLSRYLNLLTFFLSFF